MADIEHPILPLYQGKSNGCGTTSLAMALNSLQGNPSDTFFSQSQLDMGYREPDMFSAPGLLLKIAEKHGFYGQIEPEITLNAIHTHLQQGHALLWLFSRSGTVPDLHYIVLSAWREQAETGAISIGYWDPAIRQAELRWFDASKFLEMSCLPLTIWGLTLPIKPLLLIFSKQELVCRPSPNISPLFIMAYWLNRFIYKGYKAMKYFAGTYSGDLTPESKAS